MFCPVINSANLRKRQYEQKSVQEGIELWKKKQEQDCLRKAKDERELREILEKYWPWEQKTKPRGRHNLGTEEIFSHEDLRKATRQIGLQMGKPGGGAPHVSESGKRKVRTIEDPALRFQWNEDLRRCVDNSLRYRTHRQEQEAYKKQLDEQVQYKKKSQEEERRKKLDFERKMGWSNEESLKKIVAEHQARKASLRDEYEKFKQRKMKLLQQQTQQQMTQPINKQQHDALKSENTPREESPAKDSKELPPLPDGNGVEVVRLLARQRANPIRIPLCTTDITRYGQERWIAGTEYLQDLSRQIDNKYRRIKESKKEEIDTCNQHYSTLASFWGRPGNGARREYTQKGRLDQLLYHNQPISVN